MSALLSTASVALHRSASVWSQAYHCQWLLTSLQLCNVLLPALMLDSSPAKLSTSSLLCNMGSAGDSSTPHSHFEQLGGVLFLCKRPGVCYTLDDIEWRGLW